MKAAEQAFGVFEADDAYRAHIDRFEQLGSFTHELLPVGVMVNTENMRAIEYNKISMSLISKRKRMAASYTRAMT